MEKSTLIEHFKNVGIIFQNPELLEVALTHRSFLNEQKKIKTSNERFEYLGDAVLELLVSEYLYTNFPNKPEGELTNLRAKIVQTKTLAYVAKQLNLGKFIRLSRGEAASGGAENFSILADTFEAVIGAVYLDQGIKKTREFVVSQLLKNAKDLIHKSEVQDWKSRLQEEVQAQKGNSPIYKLVKAVGPDHDRNFTVAVSFFNKQQAKGQGKSKQTAEQEAAKKALEKLFKKK